MKKFKFIFLILLFLLTLPTIGYTQDYENKLNAILDRAKNFEEFAESKVLRDEYYEVLKKSYLNSNYIGKEEFDNIINQNLKLVKHDPSLDELLWSPKEVPDIEINLTSNISVQGLKIENREAWQEYLRNLKESKKPISSFKTDADAKKSLIRMSEVIRNKKEALASMEGSKKLKEIANIELIKDIKSGESFKEYRDAIDFFTYDYYFLDNFDKLKSDNPDIIYHVLAQAELGKVFNSNPEFTTDEIAKIDFTSYKPANNFELTRKQVSDLKINESKPLFKKLDHVDGGKTKAGSTIKYRLEGIKRPVNSMFSGRFHGECITGTNYSCAVRRTNIGTYTNSKHYHLLNEKGDYVGYLNKGTITHKPSNDNYYTLDVVGDTWGKNIYTQDEKTELLVQKNIFESWFDQEYKKFKDTKDLIQKGYVITDGSNYSNTSSYKQIVTTDLYKKSKISDPLNATGKDFTQFQETGSLDSKMNKAISELFGRSTNYNSNGNPVMGSLSEGNLGVHQVLLKPQETKINNLLSKSERYFYSSEKFKGLIDNDRNKAIELVDHFYNTDTLKSNKEVQKTVLESLGYFLTKIEKVTELEALSKRIDKDDYLNHIYGESKFTTKTAETENYIKQFKSILKNSSIEEKQKLIELFSENKNLANRSAMYIDIINSEYKSDKELINFITTSTQEFKQIFNNIKDLESQNSALLKLAMLSETNQYKEVFSEFIQEQIATGKLDLKKIDMLFESLDQNLKSPSVRSKYRIIHSSVTGENLDVIFESYKKNKEVMTKREWINLIKKAPKESQFNLLNRYIAEDNLQKGLASQEIKENILEVLSWMDETDRSEITSKYLLAKEYTNSSQAQQKTRFFIEQINRVAQDPFDSYLKSVKENIKQYSDTTISIFTQDQKDLLTKSLNSKINRDEFLNLIEDLNKSENPGVKSFIKASFENFSHLFPKAELSSFEVLTSRAFPDLLVKVLLSPENYTLSRTIKNNLFNDYFLNYRDIGSDQTLKLLNYIRESKDFNYLIARNSGLTEIELKKISNAYSVLSNNFDRALKKIPVNIKDVELQELGRISARGNYKSYISVDKYKNSAVFSSKENQQFSLLNYLEGSIPDGERSFLDMATSREFLIEANSKKIKFSKLSTVQQARMDKIISHITRLSDPNQMEDARQTLDMLFNLMDPDEARRAFAKFENDTFFVNMITKNNALDIVSEKRLFTNNANSNLDELTYRILNPGDKLQLISREEARLINGDNFDYMWKEYFNQRDLGYDQLIQHQYKFNDYFKQLSLIEKKSYLANILSSKSIKEQQLKAIRHAIITNKNNAFLDLVVSDSVKKNHNLLTNVKMFKDEWGVIFSKMNKVQILDFLEGIKEVNNREKSTLRNVYGQDYNFFNLLLERAGELKIEYSELKDYAEILKTSYKPYNDRVLFAHDAFKFYVNAFRGDTNPEKFLNDNYSSIFAIGERDEIAGQLNYLLKNSDQKVKIEYIEKFLNNPRLSSDYSKKQLLGSFLKHLPSDDFFDVYEKFMEKNSHDPSFDMFDNLDVKKLNSPEKNSLLLIDLIESEDLLNNKRSLLAQLDDYRLNSLIAEKKLGILHKKTREGIYNSNTKITQKEINLLMEKYKHLSLKDQNNHMKRLFETSFYKEENGVTLQNELRSNLNTLFKPKEELKASANHLDDLSTADNISKYYPENILIDELKNSLRSGNLHEDFIKNFLRIFNLKAKREGENFGRSFVNEILTPLFSGDFKNLTTKDYLVFMKAIRSTSPDSNLIPIKKHSLAAFLSYNNNDSTDWLKFLKESKSNDLTYEFFGLIEDLDVPAFKLGSRVAIVDALSVFLADLKSMCGRQSNCFKYWERNLNSFYSYHGGKKQAVSVLSLYDELLPTKTSAVFNSDIGSRIAQCFKLSMQVINKNTFERLWQALDLSTATARVPPRFLSSKNKELIPVPHIKI